MKVRAHRWPSKIPYGQGWFRLEDVGSWSTGVREGTISHVHDQKVAGEIRFPRGEYCGVQISGARWGEVGHLYQETVPVGRGIEIKPEIEGWGVGGVHTDASLKEAPWEGEGGRERHVSGGRYLCGDVVPVRRQRLMDGWTVTHLLSHRLPPPGVGTDVYQLRSV